MMPIYIKALKLVKKKFPNLILVLASPSSVSKLSANYLHQTELSIIQICENDDPLEFEKRKQILFSTSLAAIATSGTVTLELARMGAPFLVVYRASFLTEILLKTFVKLKSANLINIITDRNDVPELLFSECSDLNIYLTLTSLLTDKRLVKNQRLSVDKAMVDLGAFGLDPKIRAARSILKFLSSVEQLK
tara:strand:- start:213 stop:785 length:573 start_codon:yes stop_codon:yes gene_type:complete